jgi:hypothetical protein
LDPFNAARDVAALFKLLVVCGIAEAVRVGVLADKEHPKSNNALVFLQLENGIQSAHVCIYVCVCE